jgi:hypothetical protein
VHFVGSYCTIILQCTAQKNINFLNVFFVESEETIDLLPSQRYRGKLRYLMFLGSGRKKGDRTD